MYLRIPIKDQSRVLTYARFSRDEQRRQSIADQGDFCREYLSDQQAKLNSVEVLSDEGMSGELRNRPGIDQVRAGIEQRLWDLIIVEDSSRLFRGVAPCMDLVGWAVDQGIRVICINDGVDTANEDWQQRLEEAQRHHGQDNYYTRFRIKRAHEGLWRMGAAVGKLRPGYSRYQQTPEVPKSPKFDEIIAHWVPVIVEAYKMAASLPRAKEVDIQHSLRQIAKFLTDAGLPKSSNSRDSIWEERNVISLIRCEVYRGVEYYRKTISRKQHRTGISQCIRNPDPERVLMREMPHLRMVPDELWERANDALDGRARPGTPLSGVDHPLYGIPRDSRSLLSNIFFCGICGNKMYAEGRNEGGYRCSAARRGDCWNKATCLRDLVHAQIVRAVSKAVLAISPDIIDILIRHIESLLSDQDHLREKQRQLESRSLDLQRQQQRLVAAIKKSDSPPKFLTDAVAELDSAEKQLRWDEQHLAAQLAQRVAIPSREEIAERFGEIASQLTLGDADARPLLRELLDGPIQAVPYQPYGNSNVVLRAEFTLQLTALMPNDVRLLVDGAAEPLPIRDVMKQQMSVNLFVPSKPQQHAKNALERYRAAVEYPPTLDQLAALVGISKRTAHLALQLGKQLDAAGMSEPFVRLTECPDKPARWKFKSAN